MSTKYVYPFDKPDISRVQSMDELDYVDDGDLIRGSSAGSVMIESSSDLSLLTDYAPGSIAFTAGYENMWQKKADGTWKQFVGEEE